MGEGAKMTQSPMPPGPVGRICGGYMGRRSRVLPWEICPSAERLAAPRGVAMERAEVSRGHSSHARCVVKGRTRGSRAGDVAFDGRRRHRHED